MLYPLSYRSTKFSHRSGTIAKNQAATYSLYIVEKCFVALGANLGFARHSVCQALVLIKAHGRIHRFCSSSLYQTTPVSSIPQPAFINAVCCFFTDLGIEELFDFLLSIENYLGKRFKSKEAPREIDLDLLFYGSKTYQSDRLTVPHPRWDQRLFVLRPLADLTDDFDIPNKLRLFPNLNQEKVLCLSRS